MTEQHEYVEGVCAKCGDAENAVIICGPGPLQYLPRIHRRGARRWELIGDPRDTVAEAFAALGEHLDKNKYSGWPEYNRADILGVEREETYYEPHSLYEVRW